MINSLTIISVVLSIISFGYAVFLHRKIKTFTQGKSGASLEDIMKNDREAAALLKKENMSLSEKISILEKKMSQAVRAVQVVRFNPFPDQGGNQSFATALVDENGDGVVISSLFARERTSIFAKYTKGFKSSHELSSEESSVLEKTKNTQYGK